MYCKEFCRSCSLVRTLEKLGGKSNFIWCQKTMVRTSWPQPQGAILHGNYACFLKKQFCKHILGFLNKQLQLLNFSVWHFTFPPNFTQNRLLSTFEKIKHHRCKIRKNTPKNCNRSLPLTLRRKIWSLYFGVDFFGRITSSSALTVHTGTTWKITSWLYNSIPSTIN